MPHVRSRMKIIKQNYNCNVAKQKPHHHLRTSELRIVMGLCKGSGLRSGLDRFGSNGTVSQFVGFGEVDAGHLGLVHFEAVGQGADDSGLDQGLEWG